MIGMIADAITTYEGINKYALYPYTESTQR